MTPTNGVKAAQKPATDVALTRDELNLLSNLLNNHTEQWSDSSRGEWSELHRKLQSAALRLREILIKPGTERLKQR